ncbi:MAG: hypothetical protein PVG66_07500 [Chromatiales bacterium]|jgi:hypothetical protein
MKDRADLPSAEKILQLLQSAEADFLQQADGKTVCEIGKSGSATLDLKAAEGKMQALRDISRAMKKSANDQEALHTALQQLQQYWQSLSEISAEWRAYKQAGLQAISDAIKADENTAD